MNLFEDLCRQYAQNRIDLKKIIDKINGMFPDYIDPDGVTVIPDEIDLSKYRDFWKEYTDYQMDNWRGWIKAIDYYRENEVDEVTERELQLATYLDEKKRLKKEAGIIKLRIYLNGKSSMGALP